MPIKRKKFRGDGTKKIATDSQSIVFCIGLMDYEEGEELSLDKISHNFCRGFLESCIQFRDAEDKLAYNFPVRTAQISSKKEAKKLKQILLKEIDRVFSKLDEDLNPDDYESSLDFITDKD